MYYYLTLVKLAFYLSIIPNTNNFYSAAWFQMNANNNNKDNNKYYWMK